MKITTKNIRHEGSSENLPELTHPYGNMDTTIPVLNDDTRGVDIVRRNDQIPGLPE
jgi:hypothetical protein